MSAEIKTKNIFNSKLATFVTIRQILNPSTTKICGYNVYHLLIILFMFYMLTLSISLIVSLYYIMNDNIEISLYWGYIENFIFACFKMINILYNSKDLKKYMHVTSYNFMTYQHYNQKIFKNWQYRLTLLIILYLIIINFAYFSWGLIPLLFNHNSISIRRFDGSVEKYQLNIYNLFLIVPADMYNDNFNVFFSFELLTLCIFTYFTIIPDILIFTMIFALTCQLEAVNDAISSLGYNANASDNMKTYVNKTQEMIEVKRDVYNDLKILITDHQNVIKQMHGFYGKIRSTLFIQLFVTSSSLILILYIADLKDSITFMLYSSNWTDMDKKSKKLILFAMKLNNANDLKLKFTQTRIVNLEMFCNTIRLCYSIFSVLANYSLNKMK
ncbi:uncharacterized protein LOC112693690 isoform X2 [Sipha flava]|uniref:Odorant receptor n=1 Tax=Sipha flava TaxID=143950 RepID=A0A2S2Q0E2_9HEMI|nr:uncharacterized protein LOC112693690 isoform X2 [Sipha flava]